MADQSETGSVELLPADPAPAGELTSTVAEETIAEVAHAIRAMERGAALQLYVDVGRLIVDRFYQGDVERARSRAPKDASLRKLAEQPDMPLGRTALNDAVRVSAFVESKGGVRTCGHLGPSHLRPLLALPEPEQDRLLVQASEGGWTVQQIKAAAHEATGRKPAGGRPPLPAYLKSLHALRRYASDGKKLFADLDRTEDLDRKEARRLLKAVDALTDHLVEVRERLRARAKPKP
jgi:hypothetical protein